MTPDEFEKPIYDEDSDQEASATMRERIRKNLSELECKVLTAYLEGKSYQEMANELNRHVKSIDNALQRVKRKLERNLEGEDAVEAVVAHLK